MKKQFYLIFILFISNIFFSYAQDSIKVTIEGIGIFKINKTTIGIIEELEKMLNVKSVVTKSGSKLYAISKSPLNSITELKADTINIYDGPIYSSVCNDVRIFNVKGYVISDIPLEDLILKFYNDTLYGINCNYTKELIDAVHIKYGIGKLEKKEKEITCINKTTRSEIKLKEISYYEKWDHNNIHTISSLREFYDSKCERTIAGYFNICDIKKYTLISDLEREINRLQKERRDAEKKKKLDGF